LAWRARCSYFGDLFFCVRFILPKVCETSRWAVETLLARAVKIENENGKLGPSVKKIMKTAANRLRRRRKHRKMPENVCLAFGHHLFAARTLLCLCLRVTLILICTEASAGWTLAPGPHTFLSLVFSPNFPGPSVCVWVRVKTRISDSERSKCQQLWVASGWERVWEALSTQEMFCGGKWKCPSNRGGKERKMCHWTCQNLRNSSALLHVCISQT